MEKSFYDLKNFKHSQLFTRSRLGCDFILYYMNDEIQKTIGNKGITFNEFVDNIDFYKKKHYVSNILNVLMNQKYNNLSQQQKYKIIFNMYFGCISIFKPISAIGIYYKYKPNSVLDFTMGWGGRLLGACVLNVPNYIGIDSNPNLIKPYDEMKKYLSNRTNTNINLYFQDCLTIDYSKLDYDLVLTSPPYYNIELYTGTLKKSKKEWNDNFYKPIIIQTWKHLKEPGKYCINIPISILPIFESILGKPDEIIELKTSSNRVKLNNKPYKEFIYVWMKRKKIIIKKLI